MNNDTTTSATTPQRSSEEIDILFAQLQPQDMEQFYQSYQRWTLQRQIDTLQAEIAVLQEAIAENATSLEETRPSAIALATLAQLRARGVNDLDLLDKMLERGESWLDHTMQLLIYCERFGVMRSDYTEWCEHALEGAYDWIRSMNEAGATSAPPRTSDNHDQRFDAATEALLLQKLMSEGEETIKMPSTGRPRAKATQPLAQHKITRPLDRKVTQPLAQRKITQPLSEVETVPEASAAPSDVTQTEQAPAPSAEVVEAAPDSVATVDNAEASAVEAAAAPEESVSPDKRAEQIEGSADITGAEPDAIIAVSEPGDIVTGHEVAEAIAEPELTGEIAGIETARDESHEEPAGTEPEAIDAKDMPEPIAGMSEPSAPLEPEVVIAPAVEQEVEPEASIAAAPEVEAVQALPDTDVNTEGSDQDAAASATGPEEIAAEQSSEIVEESAAELTIIDAAFPELDDTQPLQAIISPTPQHIEAVEATPPATESIEASETATPEAEQQEQVTIVVPYNDLPAESLEPELERGIYPTEQSTGAEETYDDGPYAMPPAPQWQDAGWSTPQSGTGQVSMQELQEPAQPEPQQRPRRRRRFFLWRWLAKLFGRR